MHPTLLTIGLTGGIASGKTIVSDRLAMLGASIVDTDVLAREVVAPGSDGIDEIVATFGAAFRRDDGALDRARLRQYVFENPAKRVALERITHPRIQQRVVSAVREASGRYIVVVVPLLTDSRLRHHLHRIAVVDCPPGMQLLRLCRRDGESPESAQRMLDAQASRSERLAIADDVINNCRDVATLRANTDQLHRFYLAIGATENATPSFAEAPA